MNCLNRKAFERGFSLIEILVVLGILGLITTFMTTSPKNSQKESRRFFRRFSLMSKEIRNEALLKDSTLRIVFLITEGKSPDVWVESTSKKVLLGSEKESQKKFEDMLKKIQNEKVSTKKEKEPDPEGFKRSKKFDFSKLSPPKDLRIEKIEVAGIPDPLEKEGVIAFHYFPQGQVEEAAITFSAQGGELSWTLYVDPVTGQFIPFGGKKDLKELKER